MQRHGLDPTVRNGTSFDGFPPHLNTDENNTALFFGSLEIILTSFWFLHDWVGDHMLMCSWLWRQYHDGFWVTCFCSLVSKYSAARVEVLFSTHWSSKGNLVFRDIGFLNHKMFTLASVFVKLNSCLMRLTYFSLCENWQLLKIKLRINWNKYIFFFIIHICLAWCYIVILYSRALSH